jgi:phosphatidate cytidylyltransferase
MTDVDSRPGGPAPAPDPGRHRRPNKAGRDLPVAIAVGLGLGAVVVVPLFTVRPVFVGVVLLAVGVGSYELARSLRVLPAQPPLVPVLVGGAAMLLAAWFTGSAEALVVGLSLTTVALIAWRLAGPAPGYLIDLTSGVLIAAYVPFLGGFCMLLAVPDDGARRVITFVATVVCSDVGGYAAGVLFGRHPMAPTVSPKKSWEGFAGSALACVVGGICFLTLLYHGDGTWWEGAVFGAAVVVAATLGDLGESMLKRDLGIKDMGSLLPGHGGVMDRIDSMLVAAPVAYLLLTAFVPPQ